MLTIVSSISAQTPTEIPSWVKNTSEWWANDEINDHEFLKAIEYFVENQIIVIDGYEQSNIDLDSKYHKIPDWIKNNAKWWITKDISDSTFLNGIKWLIENRILYTSYEHDDVEGLVEGVTFAPMAPKDQTKYIHITNSLFSIYTLDEIPTSRILGLDKNKMDKYDELSLWENKNKKVAVIFPIFTSMAYSENGFYDYYSGKCNDCVTVDFKPPSLEYATSGNAIQVFVLLGYDFLSDFDIEQNPSILKNYDMIIMLHNEYSTQTIFDAVVDHSKVIYLYPNALYAKIDVNYTNKTITLVRGHGYPLENPINNGFNWENENTHPYEFDNKCENWELYPVSNGFMLNCYPEHILWKDENKAFSLLKEIKKIALESKTHQ